ncbi:uncharacterized protein [Montipora foliosa]|uniref:uncharacterized protein n=1 Tax=Montipora foliosa TaxID=591990 RepID=UPI0035F1968C
MKASSPRREWLSLEGNIQPLHSYSGLSKLREDKTGKDWFVSQDSNLLLYDNKSSKTPADSKPSGCIDVSTASLEVFVVITSKDGKDFQLSPPRDVCIFDWIMTLKEAVRVSKALDVPPSSFERGAGAGTIMGKLRNSLRRKKKVTRTMSDNISAGPNSNGSATGSARASPLREHLIMKQEHKTTASRSKSYPLKGAANEECSQTLSLNEKQEEKLASIEQAEGAASLENSCESGIADKKEAKSASTEDCVEEENKEEIKNPPVETLSVEIQTDPITDHELLSLQQQTLTKELEIEVCKLKCEVIKLIQASIKIPLKDDDLANWQLIEDIRHKDRIYSMLREARLFNPNLPDFDGSASCTFRDSYGFIRGARESESEVFHFLCRELKHHYSSFFQNRNAHALLWSDYIKARQHDSKNVFFKEQQMKSLLREGIPGPCRSEVWKSAMAQRVERLRREKGKDYYQKLVYQVERRKSLSSLSGYQLTVSDNQIKCDLLRTMPNNERFRSLDSEGVKKLSRILRAFCVHRPDISYIQGMNFIVAMFLLFMEEEDAFWSLVAVIEFYLHNYFDRSLSGALADQSVLNELLNESLPALHAHLKYYSVDISTVTFNWFITIFIDAVPFETALRIWDCFVFEGREALFRIALGLLKVQQTALLQLFCPMEIMQYIKRAARVTYDKDQLLKSSYEELKVFPTIETLNEKQAKYLAIVKSGQGEKMLPMDERRRSRVTSFTVEIPNQEKLDKPDQHEILECALATSRDLSSPVCLFCGSRYAAKVYLLDINKKEMRQLNVDLKSRVLCTDMLDDGTVLVGTVSWYIHAFNLQLSTEVWCIQLSDSVVDIAHLPEGGKVFAALADGSIAVLQNATGKKAPSAGSHIRVGGTPVTCITLVNENVWCGCGNSVVILDGGCLLELGSIMVSNSRRHQVSKLTHSKHGVWCTVRGSSCILLLDHVTFDILLKVDNVTSLETVSDSRVIAFSESRVTTIMAVGEELWVGLGNGQVLIFDIVKNSSYEDEAYLVLSENEESQKPDEGEETEAESNALTQEMTPSTEESDAHSESTAERGGENIVITETVSSDNNAAKNITSEACEPDERSPCASLNAQEVVSVTKIRHAEETCSEEQTKLDDVYYSDYRFGLKLRVHYRINEEAIRCILLVREEDPLVLSCGGSFREEGALSLWQRQREEDTDEWLPFSIKHRFTELPGPIFCESE